MAHANAEGSRARRRAAVGQAGFVEVTVSYGDDQRRSGSADRLRSGGLPCWPFCFDRGGDSSVGCSPGSRVSVVPSPATNSKSEGVLRVNLQELDRKRHEKPVTVRLGARRASFRGVPLALAADLPWPLSPNFAVMHALILCVRGLSVRCHCIQLMYFHAPSAASLTPALRMRGWSSRVAWLNLRLSRSLQIPCCSICFIWTGICSSALGFGLGVP